MSPTSIDSYVPVLNNSAAVFFNADIALRVSRVPTLSRATSRRSSSGIVRDIGEGEQIQRTLEGGDDLLDIGATGDRRKEQAIGAGLAVRVRAADGMLETRFGLADCRAGTRRCAR